MAAPSDPEKFEACVRKAFSVLKDLRRHKGRTARALACVPWMGKSTLYDRFKSGNTAPPTMGRPTMLPPSALKALYEHAEQQHGIGNPLGKRGLKKKFKALGAQLGYVSQEFTRARFMKAFQRATTTKTVLGQKTDPARFFAVTTETVGRFADLAELASEGVKPENKWVCDECGTKPEQRDREVSPLAPRARDRRDPSHTSPYRRSSFPRARAA